MLVGGAHGWQRGRAGVDLGPESIYRLAQRLPPQLLKPASEGLQPVTVGHEHVNRHATLGGSMVKERGEEASRILRQLMCSAALFHGSRAGEQGVYIHSRHGGRPKAHRGKYRETPPHVGRNRQGRDTLRISNAAERAFYRIGREEEMSPALCPHQPTWRDAHGSPGRGPSSPR